MPPTLGPRQWFRLGCLALALVAGAALADDYAPISLLMRNGQLTEAMQKADLYLAKNPRDPQMRFLKGLIQQDSGKTVDALATFTKLTEDYPELPEPYNNLAVLYAAQGQLDKARLALETALRANRGYAIAHENLGDIYARLAAQSYAQSQQLDATNNTVAPKLAMIRQLIGTPVPATDRTRPPKPAASASR
ncbi:MAG: tetratricopeptide repeat protein [Burkholderiaceae bacterium]